MTIKNHSIRIKNHGGARKNAGRPKGKLMPRTLEKAAVFKALRERTLHNADKLWNAQFAKAVGSVMVYRIDESENDKGQVKKQYMLIEDPNEIKEVLDANDGASGGVGDNYYLVTVVPPDNKAIDSMLDRTFGKAQQTVEIIEPAAPPTELDLARAMVEFVMNAKPELTREYVVGIVRQHKFPEVDERLLLGDGSEE